MKDLIKLMFLLLFLIGVISGCEKEDPKPEDEEETSTEAPALTQKVNLFMKDAMEIYYLWNEELPEIDYKYETNSEEYFDKLLYEDDRWSFVTDDIEALEASFEGVETSYGWSLAFGLFSNTGNVFAIVEFVYPNTPASQAGIKRGDIIVLMNNSDITEDNYTDLLYSPSMNITLGVLTNSGITTGSSVELTARELQLNPVVKTSVVVKDGHKIGYLFYSQYLDNYTDAIDTALQSMIDNQVTDLVIDLRYNPGGAISAAQHLCSSLAPIDVVNNQSTLVTFRWNNDLQDYWTDNQIMSQIEVDFDSEVPVKMGLNRIYFLTSSGTASASELTITGLRPYMSEVITVGDTTHGKYTGSITLMPEDIYQSSSYYEEINNWGIQPIVIRYANSVGVTDFKDGFAPDIPVADDLFDTKPLGDMEDPLFKAAIEDITGTTFTASKSAKIPAIPHRMFDRGFSKFDKNKREALLDKPEFIFEK